jgi:membrane protease YdiL (CAAX protease family)
VIELFGLNRGTLSYATSLALVVGFLVLSSWLGAALPLSFMAAWAVIGAFCEEALFRGFVQGELVPRLGAVWGVLLTAGLFGLMHIDPVVALYAFILGTYMGFVTHLSGSARTAIVCHVAHNALWAIGHG